MLTTRVSPVRVAMTPLILAFSPFDTPYANPTNKQQSTALHTKNPAARLSVSGLLVPTQRSKSHHRIRFVGKLVA